MARIASKRKSEIHFRRLATLVSLNDFLTCPRCSSPLQSRKNLDCQTNYRIIESDQRTCRFPSRSHLGQLPR